MKIGITDDFKGFDEAIVLVFNEIERKSLQTTFGDLLINQVAEISSSDYDPRYELRNVRRLELHSANREFPARSPRLENGFATLSLSQATILEIEDALQAFNGAASGHCYVDLTPNVTLVLSQNEY